jgi:hypothetical protein
VFRSQERVVSKWLFCVNPYVRSREFYLNDLNHSIQSIRSTGKKSFRRRHDPCDSDTQPGKYLRFKAGFWERSASESSLAPGQFLGLQESGAPPESWRRGLSRLKQALHNPLPEFRPIARWTDLGTLLSSGLLLFFGFGRASFRVSRLGTPPASFCLDAGLQDCRRPLMVVPRAPVLLLGSLPYQLD